MTTALVRIAASFMIVVGGFAQAANRCDKVLEYARDRSESTGTYSHVSAYARTFCQKEFESESEYRDYQGEVGFPVEGIPLKIGSEYSDSNFKQKHNHLCEDIRTGSATKLGWYTLLESANKAVLAAWNQCQKAQTRGGPIVNAFIGNETSGLIEIELRFLPYPHADRAYVPLTRIYSDRSASAEARSCVASCTKAIRLGTRIDNADRSCSCRMSPTLNSQVNFTFGSGTRAETRTVNLYQKFTPPPKTDREVFVRVGMVDLVEGHPYVLAHERTNLTLSGPPKPAVKEGVIQSPRNGKPSVVRVNVPPGAKRFKASFGYLTTPSCEPHPTAQGSGTRASVHGEAPNSPTIGTAALGSPLFGGDRTSAYREPAAEIDVELPKNGRLIYLRAGPAGNDWCADVVWSNARFTF